MSILETLQLILNIVTIPVAIVTVFLLLKQAKQLDETLKSQVYQGLIDNSLKIDQLMIENPEYRKYIYDHEPIPEEAKDLEKLWGILDFALDVVDNVKAQERFIPKPFLPGWRAFAALVLEQPATKYYMERKYGFWFEGTLYQSNAVPSQDNVSQSASHEAQI